MTPVKRTGKLLSAMRALARFGEPVTLETWGATRATVRGLRLWTFVEACNERTPVTIGQAWGLAGRPLPGKFRVHRGAPTCDWRLTDFGARMLEDADRMLSALHATGGDKGKTPMMVRCRNCGGEFRLNPKSQRIRAHGCPHGFVCVKNDGLRRQACPLCKRERQQKLFGGEA